MTLNKPSGNMYPWAYTWNPIGGYCLHDCGYCYVDKMRRRGLKKYAKDPHLVDKEFKTTLKIPQDKILFVCSCYDMFGEWIPTSWIKRILSYCCLWPDTTFLFQTKNPKRLLDFIRTYPDAFPPATMLGTTIETNRDYGLSKAPMPKERYQVFLEITRTYCPRFLFMVSIEPILDFDEDEMISWMRHLTVDLISIGADSDNHNLPEPSDEKLQRLLGELDFTEVKVKKNLKRLMPQDCPFITQR